nr:ATP-dependent 6-phosphofructokinase 2-like [Nerophis lumbriciformis]
MGPRSSSLSCDTALEGHQNWAVFGVLAMLTSCREALQGLLHPGQIGNALFDIENLGPRFRSHLRPVSPPELLRSNSNSAISSSEKPSSLARRINRSRPRVSESRVGCPQQPMPQLAVPASGARHFLGKRRRGVQADQSRRLESRQMRQNHSHETGPVPTDSISAAKIGPIKTLAINTGGGDAPGLNAVIRAVTLAALGRGWRVLGIEKGYTGLLDTSRVIELDREAVRGITHQGGTILGTTNKGHPFEFPIHHEDGSVEVVDRSGEVMENFAKLGIDALVALGGDGSMRIAERLAALGMPIVGVPKTIDNDLEGTVVTFGFDTAVSFAADAIDRLHSTAESHERVFVVEVMGRYAGWIAAHAGLAATADVILLPEIPYDIASVCRAIEAREQSGRHFSMVVVAEGAKPIDGGLTTRGAKEAGREVRLGGVAERLAADIHQHTGKETRTVVLGHLQRGGRPTARDRILSLRFGTAAVRLVEEGCFGHMVALDPPTRHHLHPT